MANEIKISYQSAKSVYFIIFNRIGQVWNVTNVAFEAYVTATFAQYKVAATELGVASKVYAGTFPSAIPAGVYGIVIREQLGGSPLETDTILDSGDYQWGGSATLPLSDLVTSGQLGLIAPLRPAYGVMIKPFVFKMVSSADHITPFTSGVISGQISRDAGNFGALQSGAFLEVGLGWYSLQALTSGDMAAKNVALVLTGAQISGGVGADQRDFSFLTQRVSGIT
jgi:hypothetical protein